MWKCDKCKKPETIIRKESYTIVGCKHIAILTANIKEDKND